MDIFWLEAEPWNDATGTAKVVRATNADLSIATQLWDGDWIPVIDGGPIFSTTVFGGAFTGQSDTSRGQISLVTGLADIDDWAALVWSSRPVRIWGGELDLTIPHQPRLVRVDQLLNGLAESFDPDEATLFLRNLMPNGLVASKTFAGTGGLEGSPSMVNTKRPLSLGRHKNRPPVLLNAGKLLFVCNAAGSLEGIDAVREAGRPLDQPFIYHASFAELDAAVVTPTEIHVHLASGAFRLGFEPQGDITADFRGKPTNGAYPTNPVAIAYCLLDAAGWPANMIDLTSTNALITAIGHEAQFHDDGGTDVADALNTLFAGCGGYWDVDPLGVFYAGLVQIGTAEDFSVGDEGLGTFDILETDFLPTRAPFYRNRVGFDFNPSVMSYADTSLGASPEQLALIGSIADLIDGEITVFFQSAEPTTGAERDLWQDTDDGKWYKLTGGVWTLTTGLGALGEALARAAGGQAAADGKVALFYSDIQPTAPAAGDLWVKPSEVPRTFRTWRGGIWTPVSTLGADLSSNIIDSGSGTTAIVPRTEIRTPLGTAAGIVGQGPAATAPRNDVYNDQVKVKPDGTLLGGGGGQVTYPGLGGKQLGLVDQLFFGSPLFQEYFNGPLVTLNGFKTSLGMAASFFGQAAAATDTTIQPGATRDVAMTGRENTNDPPQYYFGNFNTRTVVEAKYPSALGITGYATNSGTLTTIVGWSAARQMFAEYATGRTWTRSHYDNNVWSPWAVAYGEDRKPGFGADLLESIGGTIATLGAFKTGLGVSSGFFNQGAFATLNQLASDNLFGGVIANRLAPFTGDPRYLRAEGVAWAAGYTVEAYKPQEPGANVTESRTSAALFGQGPGATATGPQVLNNSTEAVTRIPAPVGGTFNQPGSPSGSLKIRLPVYFTDTMLRFEIEIYEYSVGATCTYTVSGYNYSAGAWINTAASMVGPDGYRRPVYFGHDGTRVCIWIGVAGTTWLYPQVRVTNFVAGYAQYQESLWATGWSVSLDTGGPLNVSASVATPHAGEARYDMNVLETVGVPASLTNFKTILGTASGFSGQGAFATISQVDLTNTDRFGHSGRFAASIYGAQYFSAANISYSAGNVVENYRPQEAGANVTENRTASSISGQGFGATAPRASVDNRYVPLGVNAQIDSAFARGSATWGVAGAMASARLDFNRPDYSGKRSVAYLWSPATPPSTEFADAYGPGPWGRGGIPFMQKYSMPVKLGDVIGVRILAGHHRCVPQLYLLLFDGTATLISAPSTNAGSVAGGGVGGDNLGVMELRVTVDSSVMAAAELMVRMGATGEPNPYLFFSEPWIGKLASMDAPFPAFTHGPADPTADRTLENTSAGFAGQGTLATQNVANYRTQISQLPIGLQQGNLFAGEYVQATSVAWSMSDGSSVETLKPGERGSNITETRVSSGFYSQSAWATYSGLVPTTVAGQVSRIDGNGYLPATAVHQPGVAFLSDRFPQEAGANKTETRTASGIAGQSYLATNYPARLTPSPQHGEPYLAATAMAFSGGNTVEGLRPGEAGANITENRAASSIAGQGAFATAPKIGGGNVGSYFHYSSFRLDYSNTRSDGVTTVTEVMAVTALGVASAVAGQGALATKSSVGAADIAPSSVQLVTYQKLQNSVYCPVGN